MDIARWRRRIGWWGVQYRPSPFWFLYLALGMAPWAGADRTGVCFEWTRLLLLLALISWLAKCWKEKHRPAIPHTLNHCVLWLIAQASVMAFNAAMQPDGPPSLSRLLPFSVARSGSLAALPDLFLLFGTLLCTCDISRHSNRRHEVWHFLVYTGVLWASYGLWDKIRQPAWTPNGSGRAPFATFDYHANAASYLNMIWPLAVGLLCARLRKGITPTAFFAYGLLATIPFAAEMVNTSRAGTFLAIVLAIGMLLLIWRRARQGFFPEIRSKHFIVGFVSIVVLIGAMFWVGDGSRTIYRWAKFPSELVPDHHRWLGTKAWFEGALHAGFFGFGPDSFTAVAKRFAGEAGLGWIKEWPHAHMDPLQTIIEWGWLGSIAWCVLAFGGFVHSMKRPARSISGIRGTDSWLRASIVLALIGVFIHSLVDYPFQVFPVQLLCVVCLGILWGRSRWPETETTASRSETAETPGPILLVRHN